MTLMQTSLGMRGMCTLGQRQMDSHPIIRVWHNTTDGFTPYKIVICMKYKYMFLCLIIPGPDHLGTHLNMILKPLIEELKQLWEGVEAYDYDQKQKMQHSSCVSVVGL
jgi:hypothetical protein